MQTCCIVFTDTLKYSYFTLPILAVAPTWGWDHGLSGKNLLKRIPLACGLIVIHNWIMRLETWRWYRKLKTYSSVWFTRLAEYIIEPDILQLQIHFLKCTGHMQRNVLTKRLEELSHFGVIPACSLSLMAANEAKIIKVMHLWCSLPYTDIYEAIFDTVK